MLSTLQFQQIFHNLIKDMPKSFIREIKDLKPISVNRAFYGRRYLTKEYQAYKTELGLLLGKIKPIKGYVQICLRFGVPKKTFAIADCDNWKIDLEVKSFVP